MKGLSYICGDDAWNLFVQGAAYVDRHRHGSHSLTVSVLNSTTSLINLRVYLLHFKNSLSQLASIGRLYCVSVLALHC